ncbi:25-hydroxycholesterol 7-alpha-hydroxylase, partial [Tolypocladium ophioglossoides CBS 100239]
MLTFILLAFSVSSIYFLSRLFCVGHDHREPLLVAPRIPFVGHLINIVRQGSAYYGKLSKQYNVPIFTLGVPGGKIYIVTSPSLVQAIDRRSKRISFAPYVVQFAKRILIPSQRGIETLKENIFQENGPVGLRSETLRVMHDTLAPSEYLDSMTKAMLKSLAGHFGTRIHGEGEVVDLFGWTRNFVTRASTDPVYGTEKNPIRDPAVSRAIWAIDENFALLGLNIFPSLLAPKASHGRKLFFDAMSRYYAADGHKTASALIQSRLQVNRKYGVSQADIEHFDLAVCIGLLVNTVASTAWVLFYVYSDSSLLARVRKEIYESLALARGDEVLRVNIRQVVADRQFLTSLVREVLRVQSTNASGRIVLEDTLIDNRFLLKKNSFLLIPSAEVHSSESAWGPTASQFDPERFVKQKAAQPGHKAPAAALRTFGSGASVCPGRHFAESEILAVLVIMALRFDLSPVDDGEWRMPKTRSH